MYCFGQDPEWHFGYGCFTIWIMRTMARHMSCTFSAIKISPMIVQLCRRWDILRMGGRSKSIWYCVDRDVKKSQLVNANNTKQYFMSYVSQNTSILPLWCVHGNNIITVSRWLVPSIVAINSMWSTAISGFDRITNGFVVTAPAPDKSRFIQFWVWNAKMLCITCCIQIAMLILMQFDDNDNFFILMVDLMYFWQIPPMVRIVIDISFASLVWNAESL